MKPPAWLTTLLEKGAVGYSAANRRLLGELLTLQIVSLRSAGMRRTVVVGDSDQLFRWVTARFPRHSIDPDALTRQGNIVRSGHSKSGRSAHDVLPFQFKWFGSGSDALANLTAVYGMAAVMTDRLAVLPVPVRWRMLTIENWEPFYRADYSGATIPVMVTYLGGNAPDSVMAVLKTFTHFPERVLHFGDYDWEGLYIFQRLQKAFPLARLYVPDDIESLFKQFGNRKLIDKQRPKAAFDMRRGDCLPIIRLIEQYNAGVEQEIVALPEAV